MLGLSSGEGWHQLRWTIAGAIILAFLGGGVAGWRKFTLMENQMEYLLKLNDQQNVLFSVVKDSLRDLQQQIALNAQRDESQQEKIREHEEYIKHILGRLRVIEHPTPRAPEP